MTPSTLARPFTEERVLKENNFKRVRLLRDANGERFVGKRFSGHAAVHLANNARYVYETLNFFGERLGTIARVPMAYDVDPDEHEVFLEYLPDLPSAALLELSTLSRAEDFFKTCYAIREKYDVLRSMKHSTYFTPLIAEMVHSGFPLALGFKGDLWQNLCWSNGTLILADVDSAALEPLGLSELIMHAELIGAFNVRGLAYKFGFGALDIVALRYLDREQFLRLVDAALEICERRMAHLNPGLRNLKTKFARRAFERSLAHWKH